MGPAARTSARRASPQGGFTLVELLVVMMILGILAAIAIPSFFNQTEKANDAAAKSSVENARTAIEVYRTEHDDTYAGATPADLVVIEPTLGGASLTVVSAAKTFKLTATATATGDTFSIERHANGVVSFDCTVPAKGGCPPSGNWAT